MPTPAIKKIYIFLYNILKLKSDFSTFFNPETDRFILVASKFCNDSLSTENRTVFEKIIVVKDFTVETVEKEIADYLNRSSAANIQILANEESCALICATLREKYHLNGASVATMLPFVNKITMKHVLEKKGIRIPKYQPYTAAHTLNYPLIVKPEASWGSTDTAKVNDQTELEHYIQCNTKNDQHFELEEFIEGTLCHCDGLIKNHELMLCYCCVYNTPCLNFTKGMPLGSLILQDRDPLKNKLLSFTKQVIAALTPPDGAFHLEIFVTHQGELIFLEIAARTPGAMVVPVYEKMFGINLEVQHYCLHMDRTVIIKPTIHETYYSWMIFPAMNGTVTGFNEPTIQSHYQLTYYLQLRQEVHHSESLMEIAGTILLDHTSYEQLREDFFSLQSFQPLTYG